MDKAEKAGLGIATAGHVILFGLLSVGFLATPNPLDLRPKPIEVTLSDEIGLESQAPTPSTEEPAAKLAEVEAPVEPASPPEPAPKPEPVPAPPKPQPQPAPKPTPAPKVEKAKPAPQPKPAPKAEPAPKAKAATPTGRLKGITDGLTDRASDSRSTSPPAATIGPAVQSALASEVRRQLKPHWRSPTGQDVELLRTIVEVRLARDGSIIGEPRVIEQTGVNASNRSQAELHKEHAIRAVKLAAPFKLPAEYYDAWKVIRPAFDKRLG